MSENTVKLDFESISKLKTEIIEGIIEILPTLIKEMTPIILQQSNVTAWDQQNLDKECQEIMAKDREVWNKMLNKREDKYNQIKRAETFLTLYKECLDEY